MIKELNEHLIEWINLHDEDEFKYGIIDEWYMVNYLKLASAIKDEPGLKLIVDVNSFTALENYSKRLFLLADTIIVRDTIIRDDSRTVFSYIPVSNIYDNGEKVNNDNIPPVMNHPPLGNQGYWTSSQVELNNGLVVPVASKFLSFFPKDFYQWVLGQGKDFLKTGQIVYAPFIPSSKIEMELIKQGFSIPKSFNAQTSYSVNYDWLGVDELQSLFLLNIPTIENIDIETMNKIKEDNYDIYKEFSNDLVNSLKSVKSQVDTFDFINEIRYIQKNKIDDNLNKINNILEKNKNMSSLRKLGYAVGSVGLNILSYLGFDPCCSILEKVISKEASNIMDVLREKNQLQENPYYFLWKVINNNES